MQAPLPLASYVFILRKHLWLVLGTVATVLAGGWLYARSQAPVFQATALVQLQGKPGVQAATPGAIILGDDQRFVNDQSYRLRIDEGLAARVLNHLQDPNRADPVPAPGASAYDPVEPPPPDPALFRGLEAKDLPTMITVTPVPTTSYYQFSIKAGDPKVCAGLVNGYARVFARTFAADRGRQVQDFVAPKEVQRDQRRKEVEVQDVAIEKFRKAHKDLDLDALSSPAAGGGPEGRRPGNTDRDEAASYRAALAQQRMAEVALKWQKESSEKALRAAGLRFVEDREVGFSLVPLDADGGPVEGPRIAADDPRISERILALEVVSGDDAVKKAREALEQAESAERQWRLSGSIKVEAGKNALEEVTRRQKALARAVEASLVGLAQRLVQTGKVVADYESKVKDLEEKIAKTQVILADYEVLRKKRDDLQARVDEVSKIIVDAEGLRKSIEEGSGTVRIYKYAALADVPQVAPNKPVIYLTAAVAALLLAAALSYVLEYMDDSVKTREDFDRLVRLPFLGFVPHIKETEGSPRDLVVARGKTGSPEVESFRAIRTGIQFSRPDREIRTFLVTSAGPGEGKTTVSINLASAFTGPRGRVLLIDADLRRARAHKALGVDNVRGLTNVLVGEVSLGDAIQKSSVEGLDVLASGPIPPNPAEVLGSEKMQELLREAAGRWDRVIVDSPPIVAVTDPSLLAKSVDAVFLVISVGKTSIRTIQRARETLSTVGAVVHGAILNNADVKLSGYAQSYGGYGYGYGYGYGAKS
jgi:capsular exopolysaccharide synthesis family protein